MYQAVHILNFLSFSTFLSYLQSLIKWWGGVSGGCSCRGGITVPIIMITVVALVIMENNNDNHHHHIGTQHGHNI